MLKMIFILGLSLSAYAQRTGSDPPADLEAGTGNSAHYSLKEDIKEIAKNIYIRDPLCTKEKTYLLTTDFLNLSRVLSTIPLDHPYTVACCDSESTIGSLYPDYFHCLVDEETKKRIHRLVYKEDEFIRLMRSYALSEKEAKEIHQFYQSLYHHLKK